MKVFFGPAGPLGHPFYPTPGELVVPFSIGDHEVMSWNYPWLDHGPIMPDDYKPDCVVLWNPMWLTEQQFVYINSWTHEHEVKIFGVMGDWFSGLRPGASRIGTQKIIAHLDGMVIDASGASVMRHKAYMGELIVDDQILTYGRFIELGKLDTLVDYVDLHMEDRSIDFAFIGHRHTDHVVQRSLYLDKAHEITCRNNWSWVEDSGVPYSKLENTFLDTKIVFNYAVGSMPNCRIYEALAAGCILVTDRHCLGVDHSLPAYLYSTTTELEDTMHRAMRAYPDTDWREEGLRWAEQRSPLITWTRIFDRIEQEAL